MKCTHCEYTWTATEQEEAAVCPACGKAVQSIEGEQAYKKAAAAEQEMRLADAVRDYKIAAEEQINGAAYGVYRALVADKTQSKDREVFFWLRVAAAFADPIACYKLSRRYQKEEKPALAAYYLHKSADGAYAEACLKLAASLKESGDLGGARYYLEQIKHLSFKAKIKLLFLKGKAARPALVAPASEAKALLELAKEAGAKGYHNIAYRLLCVAEPIPQVLFEKALRDLEGFGVNRPFEAVEADLAKAGEGGFVDAFMALAEIFLSGTHTDVSREKAFHYLSEAAKAGELEAILSVADSYNEGTLCPVHKEKAIYWYEKAAKRGNAGAAEMLQSIGTLLAESFAKAQNLKDMGENEKAFALYMKLAEIGHTPSASCVGMCYQKGIGVKQNYKSAAAWYKKAIEGGSAAAACNLGMLYGSNLGVAFDYRTAEKLLTAAESSGYKRAAAMLAMLRARRQAKTVQHLYSVASTLYFKGKTAEAMRYYATAAKMGHGRSMFLVALHAEFGDGMPQSNEMANHWFAKAYDAGVSDRARLKSGYLRMKNYNKQ